MKILSRVVFLLSSLTLSSVMSADAPLHRFAGAVKDRYLVILNADAPAATHAEFLARGAGGRVVHKFDTVLNGFSIHAPEAAALALTRNPAVSSVWEVPRVQKNDTQYGVHDGLDRIDQGVALSLLGLNDQYLYTMYTAPVTIYIADTGVDPHYDFGSRLVQNINFSTVNGTLDPNNYHDCGDIPGDYSQHGTSSALLAGGAERGVAKWVKLANVRVLDCGQGGSYDDVVAGVNWITNQRNARPSEWHVANASFGGTTIYTPFENAFRASVAAGVFWTVSAANDAADACNYSPARLGRELNGAITVGAMDPTTDQVRNYSNQGVCVEIFAPADVTVGSPGCPECVAGGTSAAAPHVAGVAAIRWAVSPTSDVATIESLIKSNATAGVLTGVWGGSTAANNLLLYSASRRRRAVGS